MIVVYPVIAASKATAGDTKASLARAKIFLLILFFDLVTMVGIVNSVEYLNSAENNVNCRLLNFCSRPETHDNLAQSDGIVNTIFGTVHN